MISQDPITNQATDTQSLRERLSEMEEQVANLRRLKEVLRRNAQMFEALLAGSRDGITLTTADGTLIRVVKSIFGYAPAALSGSSVLTITHPDDVPVMLATYHRLVVERAGQVSHEVRLKSPDGRYVWVEGTVTDMLENANVMAIVHNYRDITNRRRLELAARERDVLAGASGFAFFSRNYDGVVQSWSTAAETLLGYSSIEAIGQNVTGLLTDDAAGVTADACPWKRLAYRHRSGAFIDLEVAQIPMGQCGVAHLCRPSESISK